MNQTIGLTKVWSEDEVFDFTRYPNRNVKSEKFRILGIGDCNCRK